MIVLAFHFYKPYSRWSIVANFFFRKEGKIYFGKEVFLERLSVSNHGHEVIWVKYCPPEICLRGLSIYKWNICDRSTAPVTEYAIGIIVQFDFSAYFQLQYWSREKNLKAEKSSKC